MFINKTINKKYLEKIIHQIFINFGFYSTSLVIDSIKLLGFYFATISGISLNIEDLKTPKEKINLLKQTNSSILKINNQYQAGNISLNEKLINIINLWQNIIEELKIKIINYYNIFEPINNLYIMSSSGARGNLTQVRQLIGLRGLMTDPNGNIITIPIKNNFREGLTSIDYIISSYGARKGIVDTALKTADSGYLTRRLIYLVQELIIKISDCQTNNGLLFFLNKASFTDQLLGHYLIGYINLNNFEKIIYKEHQFLNYLKLNELKLLAPICLIIRSGLTCKLLNTICQKCYGWDLNRHESIAFGSTIGIIAAQSIGEPGTQLTMRTFHTGGTFTSTNIHHLLAPCSGKYKLNIKKNNFFIINWKNNKQNIQIPQNSKIILTNKKFIYKNELIAKIIPTNPNIYLLKPQYSLFSGEICFNNVFLISNLNNNFYITKNSNLYITLGTIFNLSNEAKIIFSPYINTKKAIASFVLISPFSGTLIIKNNNIFIINLNKEILIFNLNFINNNLINFKIKLNLLINNYQYIDSNTIFGIIFIYPSFNSKLYLVRKKKMINYNLFFLITKKDIFKFSNDNPITSYLTKLINYKNVLINNTQVFHFSGLNLKQSGFYTLFQKSIPLMLKKGTVLNYKHGDFILKYNILNFIFNENQQNTDIVQDLPKIEALLNLYNNQFESYLSSNPGIYLNKQFNFINEIYLNKSIISSYLMYSSYLNNIIYSFKNNFNIIKYNNQLFKLSYLLFNSNVNYNTLKLINKNEFLNQIIQQNNFNTFFIKLFKINNNITIFLDSNNNYILYTPIKIFILEQLNTNFIIVNNSLINSTQFSNLGFKLTNGSINVKNLLNIFYNYYLTFDNSLKAINRSFMKIKLILLNSIQSIYTNQDINIANIHFELIIKQITSKIQIINNGDTSLLINELINFELLKEIYYIFKINNYKLPIIKPILISMNKSDLLTNSFFSSAGFQQTKKIIINAAILGKTDWFLNLRECLILGRLMPAGSTFLNFKNYLDNIYLFKH